MASSQRNQVTAPRRQAAAVVPARPTQVGALPHERVAARAYEIWEQSGRPDGQHEEHWYRAERELRTKSR